MSIQAQEGLRSSRKLANSIWTAKPSSWLEE